MSENPIRTANTSSSSSSLPRRTSVDDVKISADERPPPIELLRSLSARNVGDGADEEADPGAIGAALDAMGVRFGVEGARTVEEIRAELAGSGMDDDEIVAFIESLKAASSDEIRISDEERLGRIRELRPSIEAKKADWQKQIRLGFADWKLLFAPQNIFRDVFNNENLRVGWDAAISSLAALQDMVSRVSSENFNSIANVQYFIHQINSIHEIVKAFGNEGDLEAFVEMLNPNEFAVKRSARAAVYMVSRRLLDGPRGKIASLSLANASQAFLEVVDSYGDDDPVGRLWLHLLFANNVQAILSNEPKHIQRIIVELPIGSFLRDVDDWEAKVGQIFSIRCSRIRTVLARPASLSRTRLEVLRERQSYALYIVLVLLFLILVVVNADVFDGRYQFIG